MSTGHTPGPWRKERFESLGRGHNGIMAQSNFVTVVHPNEYIGADEDVAEANADLIAAAPALLSVVAAFVEWAEHHAGIFRWEKDFFEPLAGDEGFVQLCNDARAAIAKARGGEVPA